MVVKAPVVFKEIVVFKDAISPKTQDPAPFPNFGDFNHFFDDFSRLHSLSVLSERAQHGKVPFGFSWVERSRRVILCYRRGSTMLKFHGCWCTLSVCLITIDLSKYALKVCRVPPQTASGKTGDGALCRN